MLKIKHVFISSFLSGHMNTEKMMLIPNKDNWKFAFSLYHLTFCSDKRFICSMYLVVKEFTSEIQLVLSIHYEKQLSSLLSVGAQKRCDLESEVSQGHS